MLLVYMVLAIVIVFGLFVWQPWSQSTLYQGYIAIGDTGNGLYQCYQLNNCSVASPVYYVFKMTCCEAGSSTGTITRMTYSDFSCTQVVFYTSPF